MVNTRILLKLSLSLLLCFASGLSYAQVDYFDIEGEWAGNDANGNAVIKWRLEICAGTNPATNVTVRVPATERDETQSGATGIADEDSPADDSVCFTNWNTPGNSGSTLNGNFCDGGGDWDNFKPSDYQTTGILVENATLCANRCAYLYWTTYSKDYDSSDTDYDHYVVANWSSDDNPLNPGFDCIGATVPDHTDCSNTNSNCGASCPECTDQIECEDVVTNNYEQLLGIGFELIDGPNFRHDCDDDFSYDMTFAYVACHHGQSDYEAGYDMTSPGESGAVDILPDAITNIQINSRIADYLDNQGATVIKAEVTNPGTNQYLVVNPNYDGISNSEPFLTLPSSTIPSGVEEELDVCTPAQPECDTIHLYIEWKPNDLQDMFNNVSSSLSTCDNTGNINSGDAVSVSSLRSYWHMPYADDYVPLNGYQNAGTTGTPEGPPREEGTNNLNPDPEFSTICGSTDSGTCNAGPAEDCAGASVRFGYVADVNIDKNTLSIIQNTSNPDNFDVTYEVIVTNSDTVALKNIQVSDDLVSTFGSAAGYLLPFVQEPTFDNSIFPNPPFITGYPTFNTNYDGNTDINIFDGSSGLVQPGESFRFTFTVTVDRSVVGATTDLTNAARVDANDCREVWCVSDRDTDIAQMPACSLTANATQIEPDCDNTDGNYFTISVEASATNEGTAQQFEVVLNANPDGSGGQVLGTSSYGAAIIVGDGTNGLVGTFAANGASIYTITIRDTEYPDCFDTFTTMAVEACPFCREICLPVNLLKD